MGRAGWRLTVLSGLLLATLGLGLGSRPAAASTDGQATAGLQVFRTTCASCHGDDLGGGGSGPALRGASFAARWGNPDALRDYIQARMPWPTGGVLTTEQATNVAAYLQRENGVPPDGFASPLFRRLWTVSDGPVAAGQARRSWLWGPEGFALAWEEYAASPGGRRLVQYFDKARMEISRPEGSAGGAGSVSNGLLASELISGRLQTGDSSFAPRRPAEVAIAGDTNDELGPTYATFSRLTAPTQPSRAPVVATVDRAGTVGQEPALGAATSYVQYVAETGHNIPGLFWDYLNSVGPTSQGGQIRPGRLFEPWYAAVGLPITEAYWARARVGGEVRQVLVQCYERRCLTYTPGNPEGFRVEMGNVGRHYYQWRYGS